jgi:hypothetical protein
MRYTNDFLLRIIVYIKSIIIVIIIFAYVIADDDEPRYLPANIDTSAAKINLIIMPKLDAIIK